MFLHFLVRSSAISITLLFISTAVTDFAADEIFSVQYPVPHAISRTFLSANVFLMNSLIVISSSCLSGFE